MNNGEHFLTASNIHDSADIQNKTIFSFCFATFTDVHIN